METSNSRVGQSWMLCCPTQIHLQNWQNDFSAALKFIEDSWICSHPLRITTSLRDLFCLSDSPNPMTSKYGVIRARLPHLNLGQARKAIPPPEQPTRWAEALVAFASMPNFRLFLTLLPFLFKEWTSWILIFHFEVCFPGHSINDNY